MPDLIFSHSLKSNSVSWYNCFHESHVICLPTYKGGVLVAADYSQLELRMIAHLSQDTKLISILNEGGDVFKTIAAQWKGVEPYEVSGEQRQQAKQVS